jgi:hypothetical protein
MTWRDGVAIAIEYLVSLNWPLYFGWLLFGVVLIWILFSQKRTVSEVRGAGVIFAASMVMIWYGWFMRQTDS